MAGYAFVFKDDSLSHHGIEGQKWGVRNGRSASDVLASALKYYYS